MAVKTPVFFWKLARIGFWPYEVVALATPYGQKIPNAGPRSVHSLTGSRAGR